MRLHQSFGLRRRRRRRIGPYRLGIRRCNGDYLHLSLRNQHRMPQPANGESRHQRHTCRDDERSRLGGLWQRPADRARGRRSEPSWRRWKRSNRRGNRWRYGRGRRFHRKKAAAQAKVTGRDPVLHSFFPDQSRAFEVARLSQALQLSPRNRPVRLAIFHVIPLVAHGLPHLLCPFRLSSIVTQLTSEIVN